MNNHCEHESPNISKGPENAAIPPLVCFSTSALPKQLGRAQENTTKTVKTNLASLLVAAIVMVGTFLNSNPAHSAHVEYWRPLLIPIGVKICLDNAEVDFLAAANGGAAAVATALGVSAPVAAVLMAVSGALVAMNKAGGNRGLSVYVPWSLHPLIPWVGC